MPPAIEEEGGLGLEGDVLMDWRTLGLDVRSGGVLGGGGGRAKVKAVAVDTGSELQRDHYIDVAFVFVCLRLVGLEIQKVWALCFTTMIFNSQIN